MRIITPKSNADHIQRSRSDLRRFITQLGDRSERPCSGCDIVCPCCGSVSCICRCSCSCPDAARRLSSDPDKYPIEPGILPLVYVLQVLREVPPCWSCEGHEGANNEVCKPPRVWFTARSVFYPDLIAEQLAHLRVAKRLAADWQVCLVEWGQRTETTFSIEPKLSADGLPSLSNLQNDVRTIAKDLPDAIKALARRRLFAFA